MSADQRSLYRLLSWLSPSFPVGAYAFSHGIEWQVEHGGLITAPQVQAWIEDLLVVGSGQTDLVVCAAAWSASTDAATLQALDELIKAFSGTRERLIETEAQGTAFVETVSNTWPMAALSNLPERCAYPVAVGAVAAMHDVGLEASLTGYAHAFAANLVSAAVRLVPLGQTDGQRVTAGLEATVQLAVKRAQSTDIDALSSATMASDIASMRHETQYTRLFRS